MSSADKENSVCAIYTDMSKAFDLHNQKFLENLIDGIRGNILKRIESYLTNRLQCTDISRIYQKVN